MIYTKEDYGNDCIIYRTYVYHRGYIVTITSYSHVDDTNIGKEEIREFRKWALMYDSELAKWVEEMILKYE